MKIYKLRGEGFLGMDRELSTEAQPMGCSCNNKTRIVRVVEFVGARRSIRCLRLQELPGGSQFAARRRTIIVRLGVLVHFGCWGNHVGSCVI